MKARYLACIASFALASAVCAQAHQIDPGGRIEVACPASGSVHMASISRAVDRSHYWAPQAARKQMLALARETCERGAASATFVPPADQRYLPQDAGVADTAARTNRVGA